jgi:curved DNA binding protein
MSELTDPFVQLDDDRNLSCYQTSGAIAARVLDTLVEMCKEGVKLIDICKLGDDSIVEEVNKIHKKIISKGIAFPTCVSVNHVAGQYNNPRPNEVIKEGDIVKIELGVHINGFPAQICYTIVVNENGVKLDDKKVSVVKAAAEAAREVLKIMIPGKSNMDVLKAMEKAAAKYNCQLPYADKEMHAPGIVSYQVSQHVVDGFNEDYDKFIHTMIINRDCDEYDFIQIDQEFEENEVYAIDVLMSSGTGKLTELEDTPCTIFKRNQDKKSMLKMKASKNTLNFFGDSRFPTTTKDLDYKFKFGLKECVTRGLIESILQ